MKKRLYIIAVVFLLCQRSFSQGTTVDRAIAHYAELNELNKQVLSLVAQVAPTLGNPTIRKVFDAQQTSWHVEMENLSNSYYNIRDAQLVQDLQRLLNFRIVNLNDIIRNNEYITQHASDYSYIQPWYLKQFEKQYLGKKVFVFGSMAIPDAAHPTLGVLSGIDPDRTSVITKFKSMPEEQHRFIQEKYPLSWYEGVVTESEGKIYLYLTNLLGIRL